MSPGRNQKPPDIDEVVRPLRDTYRILHVDDDSAWLDLATTFLEREQEMFEIVTETSALDAFERLEAEEFDGIISDYDMPEMDGLAFLSDVRNQNPDIPFILFTGKGSEEIASDAISAGVTDYLQKGGGSDRYGLLANRMLNAIDRHHANQQMVRAFKALETAREGISLLDEDGYFLYVNDAFADIAGYEPTTLLDSHWEVLYPEENVDIIHDEILPTVPVEGRWSGITTYVRNDGDRIQVDHALTYTEDGTLICLIQEVAEGRQ